MSETPEQTPHETPDAESPLDTTPHVVLFEVATGQAVALPVEEARLALDDPARGLATAPFGQRQQDTLIGREDLAAPLPAPQGAEITAAPHPAPAAAAEAAA